MSAGNFDCAALLESKVMLNEIWSDSQEQTDYIAEVEALKVVQSNQRGMALAPLQDPLKDRSLKVIWLSNCPDGTSVEDVADVCTIEGTEIGDNCKDYELTRSKMIEFKVPRKAYRRSMWSKEEVAAKALLVNMKALDEYIAQDFISIMDTFSGYNQLVTEPFTQAGNVTTIPAAYWTPNLFGYFAQAAIKNRMRDAYMLSGNNLFQTQWMVDMETGNAQNGAANARKMGSMNKYWDLFNLDSVLGAQKTFLIRPSSLAFVSKNYNTNSTPIAVGGNVGQDLYNIQSKNLPFLTYDVIHTVECEDNEYWDKWRLEAYYDVLQNPSNCNGQLTGQLAFKCA